MPSMIDIGFERGGGVDATSAFLKDGSRCRPVVPGKAIANPILTLH